LPGELLEAILIQEFQGPIPFAPQVGLQRNNERLQPGPQARVVDHPGAVVVKKGNDLPLDSSKRSLRVHAQMIAGAVQKRDPLAVPPGVLARQAFLLDSPQDLVEAGVRLLYLPQGHQGVTSMGIRKERPGSWGLSVPPPVECLQILGELQGQGVLQVLEFLARCAGQESTVGAGGVLPEPPFQPCQEIGHDSLLRSP
jgi:hypothetical protein